MNRVIKFRAYGGETMKYFVRFDILSEHGRDYFTDEEQQSDGSRHILSFTDVEAIQQFTGLLDKNGKEIYEGDIVQCDVRIEGRIFKTASGEVYYGDNVAAFCVMLDDEFGSVRAGPSPDGSKYALTMEQLREFLVIGNIYENPELLKEEVEEK